MLGHGSPVLRLEPSRSKGRPAKFATAVWLPALFLWSQLLLLITFPTQVAAQINEAEVPQQPPFEVHSIDAEAKSQFAIRMSWGGGEEAQWQGSVHYTGGPIHRIRALGLTQDTPGSVYLDNGNVNVSQQSPATYGGAEFYIDFQPGAELQTVFRSVTEPEKLIRKSIPVEELLRGTHSHELDAQRNRITIARSPGDWLKVDFQQDHLVFETGETLVVDLQPSLTGFLEQRVRCKATLVAARSKNGAAIWSEVLEFETDSSGSSLSQRLMVPVPSDEGVYDLKLQLEPRGFTNRFGQSQKKRSLQFVALSPAPPVSSGDLWREQDVIDPTQNRTGMALQWSQLLRSSVLRNGSSDSGRSTVEHNGEKLVELEPGGWQVIDLRLNQVGKPVLLEVDYVANEGAAIGFSVLQPDAQGKLPTYGFDSGVVVPESFAVIDESNPKLKQHQIVFWPNANQSFLLISNRGKSESIRFGKVRVLTGPDRLAADRQLPDGGLKDRTRQFLAFYESPMFPENFGADEVYEAAIDQTLDDWVTFYEGADRLIQYLKANGYSGAVLTAAADSGAIYPSDHLGATPIFESGVFFASGQDPVQKDVLELLFRMFDREGLTLVPAFAFSGPIPELESRIRAEGADRYRPVDFRGQVGGVSDSRVAYNPLSLAVQRQVELIVEELTDRYTHHKSFRGVSLLCRPDTYTQLNGRRWGYDSPTVTKFLDESGGIQLTSGVANNWSQIQNLLLGPSQKQWMAWRSKQMSNWYQRLHQIVSDGKRGRRLYLAAVDIYRHSDIVSSLSPSLHWSNKFDEAMLELGWDMESLQENPSVVFLKPHRIDENTTVAGNKIDAQVGRSRKATQFYQQQAVTGEIFTHRTYWARFSELQGSSAFQKTRNEDVLRLQQLTPASSQNRKRFINSLRNLDSRLLVDGGWLLAMGQETSLADLIDVYTRLPDLPFATVDSTNREMNGGAIAVRQAMSEGRWYFYCLNDSPWKTDVTLVLNRGNIERVDSLSEYIVRMEELDGKRVIRLELPPYSLIGGFCDSLSNQLVDFDYRVDERAATRLKARLNQLQLRLIQATDVKPMDFRANFEFEESAEQPVRWSYDPSRESDFVIQKDTSGNSSLVMKSTGNPNWIRSLPFETPETGRLSVSVWMRTGNAAQPPLRISVEGDRSGYYRFGSIGSLAPDDPSNQVGPEWRQYVVHFDDLPVEQGARLRVGFDLMGAGEVEIDQVQLYDRLFDANDIQALTQRLAAARPLIGQGTDYDQCRRMLNGYWLRFLNDYIGMPERVEGTSPMQGDLIVDQQPVVRTSSLFQRFRDMMTPRLNRR